MKPSRVQSVSWKRLSLKLRVQRKHAVVVLRLRWSHHLTERVLLSVCTLHRNQLLLLKSQFALQITLEATENLRLTATSDTFSPLRTGSRKVLHGEKNGALNTALAKGHLLVEEIATASPPEHEQLCISHGKYHTLSYMAHVIDSKCKYNLVLRDGTNGSLSFRLLFAVTTFTLFFSQQLELTFTQ